MTSRLARHDGGDQEEFVVVARRIGQGLLARQAGLSLVGAEDRMDVERMCHGLDASSVDSAQLLDKANDLAKLLGKLNQFGVGEFEPRQRSYFSDFVSREHPRIVSDGRIQAGSRIGLPRRG